MSDTEELMMLMEKRADEREEKLFKLYTESEDKRRDKEREHETNMTRMMLSFMVISIAWPSLPTNVFYVSLCFFLTRALYFL